MNTASSSPSPPSSPNGQAMPNASSTMLDSHAQGFAQKSNFSCMTSEGQPILNSSDNRQLMSNETSNVPSLDKRSSSSPFTVIPNGQVNHNYDTPNHRDLEMRRHHLSLNLSGSEDDRQHSHSSPHTTGPSTSNQRTVQESLNSVLEWDWDIEHEDRKREAKADKTLHGSLPFEVDRRVLKDVVREKMGVEVGRITFLSSGTFHKAYLVTLVNLKELIARVARRFMPRLKTSSEVATMAYIRQHTTIPIPTVYDYDANPYNRLGGEYILMSKAPGIPLSRVYHTLGHGELVKLLENMAKLLIPLFAHRFDQLGSLYFGSDPDVSSRPLASTSFTPADITATPKAWEPEIGGSRTGFPFTMSRTASQDTVLATPKATFVNGIVTNGTSIGKNNSNGNEDHSQFHVGQIISWPFFGSNRGDLVHPTEIDRGPWRTTHAYLSSCASRETLAVQRENAGKSAPHKLHLDPAEIRASRHHHLNALPGDESDESDDWDLEESEGEWEGPGDVMYRDYRRMQRSTFLVAHLSRRVDVVKGEMERWMRLMERLVEITATPESVAAGRPEEFGLDLHDLSLENVFVDEGDHTRISCIIDWESTTTRPLWACAHLPAFLQSSPFTANLFRSIVAKSATATTPPSLSSTSSPARLIPLLNGKPRRDSVGEREITTSFGELARDWLNWESSGVRLRMAHRFVEWDGWEEGLIDSILGGEEDEEKWYKSVEEDEDLRDSSANQQRMPQASALPDRTAPALLSSKSSKEELREAAMLVSSLKKKRHPVINLPAVSALDKEQLLTTSGDFCGGRGGELGRRLEAWLSVTGSEDGDADGEGEGDISDGGESSGSL